MWICRSVWLGTLALATACAMAPAPVAVEGSPDDLIALVGDWSGVYAYDGDRRRGGSIIFRLDAAGDTARGDVLMTLPGAGAGPVIIPPPGEAWLNRETSAEVLAIRFVRTARDTVTGSLDPYVDPDCGCTVVTTFQGRVQPTVIEGTFTARRAKSGEVSGGRWTVERRK